MLDWIINFLTSLKLTVVCLCLALLLVFFGTMGQEDLGLYIAQAKYFRSWIIIGSPFRGITLPLVLPGGYLLGSVLLTNLLAAHIKRFTFSRKKIGILMVHAGLILLLLGQLLTDVLSRESAMRLSEGQSKSYSESFHQNELVLVDASQPESDEVVSIPEPMIARRSEIKLPQTPFTLRVKKYWPNSDVLDRAVPVAEPSGATQGAGVGRYVISKPETTKMDDRNLPGAVVEVLAGAASLGTWLVSPVFGRPQSFEYENRTYHLALRFLRHYQPYSIELIKFSHDKYKGTDTPKNFSSRIRINNPDNRENREVLIYMNNPLRYQGTTFYQGSFDPTDAHVSILQVVRNPGWLTPYFACALVAAGLLVQFLTHLLGFIKRRTA